MEEQKWQCENPKCRAVYAEYVNGCPKCATGEAGGSYSVVLTKKENGWIKITKDTLPPKGESVLVCKIDSAWPYVKIGYLLSEFPAMKYSTEEFPPDTWEFSVSCGVGSEWECPTHWMPLPEKPWQP